MLKDAYLGTSGHSFYRDVCPSTPQCTHKEASPAGAFVGGKTLPSIRSGCIREESLYVLIWKDLWWTQTKQQTKPSDTQNVIRLALTTSGISSPALFQIQPKVRDNALTEWMTLGTLLNLFVPQFPPQRIETVTMPCYNDQWNNAQKACRRIYVTALSKYWAF